MGGIGRFARKSKSDTKAPEPKTESAPEKSNEESTTAPVSQGFGALGSRPCTGTSDFLNFNINEQPMQFDFTAAVPESVATDSQNGDEISKVTNFDEGTNFDVDNLGFGNDFAATTTAQGSNVFASSADDFSYNIQNETSFGNNEALFTTSSFAAQNESDVNDSSSQEENDIKTDKTGINNNNLTPTTGYKKGLSFAQKMKLRKQEREQKTVIQERRDIEIEGTTAEICNKEHTTDFTTVQPPQDDPKNMELSPTPNDTQLENADGFIQKSSDQLITNNSENLNKIDKENLLYGSDHNKQIIQNIETSDQNEKVHSSDDFNTEALDSYTTIDQEEITAPSSFSANNKKIENHDESKQLTQLSSNTQETSPTSNTCSIEKNNDTKITEVAEEVKESENDIKLVEATKNMIAKLQEKMNGHEKNMEKEKFLDEIKGNEDVQQKNFDDTSIKKNIVLSPNSFKNHSDGAGKEASESDDDDDILDVTPHSTQLSAKNLSGNLKGSKEEEPKLPLMNTSVQGLKELKVVTQVKPPQAIDNSIQRVPRLSPMKTNIQGSKEQKLAQVIPIQAIDSSIQRRLMDLEKSESKQDQDIKSNKVNVGDKNSANHSFDASGNRVKPLSNFLDSRLHAQNDTRKFEQALVNKNNTSANAKMQQSKAFYENRATPMQTDRNLVSSNKRQVVEPRQNKLGRNSHTPPRSTFKKMSSPTVAVTKPACKENSNERNLPLEKKTSQTMNEAKNLDHRHIISVQKEVNTINQNELRRTLERRKEFLKSKPVKNVLEEFDQNKDQTNKDPKNLINEALRPVRKEMHLNTTSMHLKPNSSTIGNKINYDTENLALYQDMNHKKRKPVDSHASFEVLLSKFLKEIRDANDVHDKCDSEMLDLNLQLSHAQAVSLKYLGDMVDLLEDVNDVMSTGNECVSMFDPYN